MGPVTRFKHPLAALVLDQEGGKAFRIREQEVPQLLLRGRLVLEQLAHVVAETAFLCLPIRVEEVLLEEVLTLIV